VDQGDIQEEKEEADPAEFNGRGLGPHPRWPLPQRPGRAFNMDCTLLPPWLTRMSQKIGA